MQPETPEALRAEARKLRRTAAWHAEAGRDSLARRFRAMADDCDQRAAQLENPTR
jgi:hypothetical protein